MKVNKVIRTILASLMLAVIISFQPAIAHKVTEVEIQELHRSPIAGVEGKEMLVVRLKAPPGWVTANHLHPGALYLFMLSGELTIILDDGETTTIKAGEFAAEPMNVAMIGKNPSATKAADALIFQVADIGKPLMVNVE
jgi:quercetin dioxygenase-like cupin family protein